MQPAQNQNNNAVVAQVAPTLTPTPTATPTPTNTPTPKPRPTAKPVVALPPSEYEAYFDQYSAQYGVSKDLLKHIAKCESGINPGSRSANGLYGGMFQFLASTWSSTRTEMGLDPNPELRFNAEEAIRTAAYKISKNGAGAWAGCL
jgi:soluble lytic murein transglycosylase-like protein